MTDIKLNNSTLATASGSTITLNSGVVFPAGHVIDFKTATITNEIASALSNDVWFNTGLSASITPKYTNSKIYIISHAGVAANNTLHNALKVVRTGPATADLSIQSTYNSTGYLVGLGTYTAYDSPNTDSVECTYTLHLYVDNYANSQYYYNYDAQFASTATLSLMEIKQ
tara:strand:- start:327 stop:836 length:510 start_codon:yes stop_codon:yes gene_type:complete